MVHPGRSGQHKRVHPVEATAHSHARSARPVAVVPHVRPQSPHLHVPVGSQSYYWSEPLHLLALPAVSERLELQVVLVVQVVLEWSAVPVLPHLWGLLVVSVQPVGWVEQVRPVELDLAVVSVLWVGAGWDARLDEALAGWEWQVG